MTALLQVAGLAAGYGGPPVIEDVTFELQAGERVGVLLHRERRKRARRQDGG